MNRVAIGLGSNIQPAENIARAKEILSREFQVLRTSTFKKTKAVDATEHPDFINGVLLLETPLSQEALKARLYEIEEELGRPKQGNRSAPRTIDLDIIVWNGKIVDPDYYTRDFLQEAIQEVWPLAIPEKFR